MGPRQRLVVEIDRDSEPISGLVRALDGRGEQARRFDGYMELIAALEQAGGEEAGLALDGDDHSTPYGERKHGRHDG